jgi:endo-1,4-beta-xylanase
MMRDSGESFDLVVLSSEGKPVPALDLGGAMVVGLDSMPPFEHRAVTADGKVTLPAPDGPFAVSLLLAVAGFGHVYVRADNRGVGYHAEEVKGRSLNFCLEAAESRAAAVIVAESRFRNAGGSFSSEYGERMASAQTRLEEARARRADDVACAKSAMASLCDSLQAGEMLVVEHARNRIAASPPRTDFRFGCATLEHAKSGAKYEDLFSALLDFATLPFYRRAVEPEENARDYGRIERILEWTERAGLTAKGHPLVYLNRSGLPDWLAAKGYEEAEAAHREYVLDAVTRFRGRIDIWDVINEAHDWANDPHYDLEQLVEMTRLAADAAREASPEAVRIVNSCCTWSEYVARGRTYYGPIGRSGRNVLQYLRDVIDTGVDFEVVGVQMYYPAQDMFEIDRQLDRFCAFGKPVHVTELGVSSSPEPQPYYRELRTPSPHYWHGRPWSEREQADWIEAFYTICYGKPGIEAVSWWNFVEPSFVPHSALVKEDLEPKDGYHRLQRLIADWRRGAG